MQTSILEASCILAALFDLATEKLGGTGALVQR